MGEAGDAMQYVWTILLFAGIAALCWFAYGLDPHWVAKDGKAFTCKIQPLGRHNLPDGRWREARCFVEDGGLYVRVRRTVGGPKPADVYDVVRRSDDPPKGKIVYLLAARRAGSGATPDTGLAAIRIPASSRAAPHLDEVMTGQ
jgi:hypothetical protein